MGNQTNKKKYYEQIFDVVDNSVRELKIQNKETQEEVSLQTTLNTVVDKVEKALNIDGENTIKNTFYLLSELITRDYFVRMINPTDPAFVSILSNQAVKNEVVKFALSMFLLYPHLIENKLELKEVKRTMEPNEREKSDKLFKVSNIAIAFYPFGVDAHIVVKSLSDEGILSDEDILFTGVTKEELVKIKDISVDDKVKNTIIEAYNNYDSITNGTYKLGSPSLGTKKEDKVLN